MLTVVSPGDLEIFRVARRSTRVFAPTDWQWANPVDGTFGCRFDDPRALLGRQPEQRFRVIYCATRRLTALAESLASIRTPISHLHRLLLEIDDDGRSVDESLAGVYEGTFDPADPARAVISRDWRSSRQIGRASLAGNLRFVDITTAESFQELRHAVSDVAYALGVEELDLSSITSRQRRLTQACARYIFELTDEHGKRLFDGIRYASHLDANWECWAIFDDSLSYRNEFVESTIHPDDPDLEQVARLFDLSIEVVDGHYLRPTKIRSVRPT